jgi:hypothetical protein
LANIFVSGAIKRLVESTGANFRVEWDSAPFFTRQFPMRHST